MTKYCLFVSDFTKLDVKEWQLYVYLAITLNQFTHDKKIICGLMEKAKTLLNGKDSYFFYSRYGNILMTFGEFNLAKNYLLKALTLLDIEYYCTKKKKKNNLKNKKTKNGILCFESAIFL